MRNGKTGGGKVSRRRGMLVIAEAVERRTMLSGGPPGAVLANGILTVTGTSGADSISVSFSTDQSTATVTGTFTTVVDGNTQTFNTPGTTLVQINSGDGNDTITVNGTEVYETPAGITPTPVDVAVISGNGNDSINSTLNDITYSTAASPTVGVTAGNGNDQISADGGAEIGLTAGNGNDTLEASQYQESDVAYMTAGNGNDTFIAGSTLTGSQNVAVIAGTGNDTFENTDYHDVLSVGVGTQQFNVDNQHAAFTGTAFVDENGTGVYADNDPLLTAATVYLDNKNDGTVDTGDPSAVTDEAGQYLINNVDPTKGGTGGDSYTTHVRVAPTAGYTAGDLPVTVNFGTAMSNINPYLTPVSTRLTGTLQATPGSYQNDGNTAANAVDGNLNTFFDAPTANGNYVGLNLGSAKLLTSIEYSPRPGWAQRMVGGIFQGSNNAGFTNATTLYTITTAPATGAYTTVPVANPAAYQYVRYLAPAGSFGDVAEVQFYGIAPGAAGVFNNVLTVAGTSGADNISAAIDIGGPVSLGLTLGIYTIDVNGVTQTFNAQGITGLVINSSDGNDTIAITGDEIDNDPTYTPPFIQTTAGNGNDSISDRVESSGDSLETPAESMMAGNGTDTVFVGGGTLEHLTLGNGNDTVNLNSDANFESLTTVVAGNGNDSFDEINSDQAATVTAGTGHDKFFNDDRNGFLVGIVGGTQFSVANAGGVITGKSYFDTNGDGIYQPGEPLLAGATVYIDNNSDDVFDAGDTSVTTDANGNYLITGLPFPTGGGNTSVTYSLAVVPPAGDKAVPLLETLDYPDGGPEGAEAVSGINLSVVAAKPLTGTLVATAGSYQNDGNTAAKAVDGNLNTYFDAPTANGNYVGLNLGSPDLITSIEYAPRVGWAQRMVGGIFQGSSNASFSGATTLYTITTAPVTGAYTAVSVANPAAYQYVRYLSPNGSFGDVAEVRFFGTVPEATVVNGVLTVNGTAGADDINIQFGQVLNDPSFNLDVTVNVDGAGQTFNVSSLTAVVINSGAGNDTVEVASGSDFELPNSLAMTITMGDGNDSLDTAVTDPNGFPGGELVNETILAGNGNDSISIESGGTASVTVGNGNDSLDFNAFQLFAGSIAATVTAGNGNDLFTAGGGGYNAVTINAGTGNDTLSDNDPDDYLTGTFGGIPITTTTVGGSGTTGVAGRVYVDNNGDGVYDAGDTVVAGARVFIDTNLNGQYDAGESTAVTDANGDYFIPDIGANTADPVQLDVVAPAGYGGESSSVLLPGSEVITPVNLAVKPIGRLTGTLVATAGSYQNDGNTAAKAVDGNINTYFDGPTANGNYVGLNLGTPTSIATISYAPRPGWAQRMVGGIFQGSNSSNFSSPVTLYTVTTAPAVGVLTTVPSASTLPFEYVRYLAPSGSFGDVAEVQFFANPAVGSVNVHLFNDANGDGMQDNTETGLAGFGAFLDLNKNGLFDGNDIRETADTSGNMTFANLPVGTYWLEQMVPAGYVVTTPSTGFPVMVTVTADGVATVTVGEEYTALAKLTGTPIGTAGSYNNLGNTIANAFDGNLVSCFDAPVATGPGPGSTWAPRRS
jgi:hypothetical protein